MQCVSETKFRLVVQCVSITFDHNKSDILKRNVISILFMSERICRYHLLFFFVRSESVVVTMYVCVSVAQVFVFVVEVGCTVFSATQMIVFLL